MLQIAEAVFSCGLFLIAGIAGLVLHGYLPERHRDRDTMDFVRLAVGSLVTFLAIVLGLLSAVGPFAIDMYLPALPSISANLNASTMMIADKASDLIRGKTPPEAAAIPSTAGNFN